MCFDHCKGHDEMAHATVSEDDETEALDLVYAWLGGDRAARSLLALPEYDTLTANIAQALADRSAEASR